MLPSCAFTTVSYFNLGRQVLKYPDRERHRARSVVECIEMVNCHYVSYLHELNGGPCSDLQEECVNLSCSEATSYRSAGR